MTEAKTPEAKTETPAEAKAGPSNAKRSQWELFQAAERYEWIAEAMEGEITPEVEAAHAAFLSAEGDALEAMIDYHRYSEAMIAAAKAEIDRLSTVVGRYQKRRDSCRAELQLIVERRVEGTKKRSITVGTHRLKLVKGREFVAVDPEVDPELLPPHVVRWVDPKPGHHEVDKKAAKDAIRRGDKIPGVRIARNRDGLSVE